MSQDEMKKVLLEILDNFVKFCENNDLNYFLDAGTLLGAIRHKGFIPWDDDIDVNMPRADYDRFSRIVKLRNNYITEHCYVEFPEDTIYPYIKIADNRTILVEFPDKNPMECGVYIDVFPKDSLVDEGIRSKVLCQLSALTHLWHWFNKFSIYAWKNDKNIIKRFIAWIGRMMIKDPNRPVRIQTKLIDRYNKKYANLKCNYVTTLVNGEYEKRAPIECFCGYFMGKFEDRLYRIPNGYDVYLRCLYPGDYMQLPPEDKRYHHNTIVYSKDKNAKEEFFEVNK